MFATSMFLHCMLNGNVQYRKDWKQCRNRICYAFVLLCVIRWGLTLVKNVAEQKVSRLFRNPSRRILKYIDAEKYLSQSSAEDSGCCNRFSALDKGHVQDTFILDLENMDDIDLFRIYFLIGITSLTVFFTVLLQHVLVHAWS